MLFKELDLHPEVQGGVESAGFEECTEVQERAIPPAILGRDLKVQSQTGSGKTAAFLLPVFHRYLTGAVSRDHKTLIIAPTRELADQIYQEAVLLGSSSQLKFSVCYGGIGYEKQEKDLAADPHVIIGTPGRLMDHAKSNRIDFGRVGVLIIDEADRMFDMGFYPDVRYMAQRMPGTDVRQTMLFSATLSVKVMDLAWEYMHEPVEITVDAEQITVDTIEQVVYHVGKNEKMPFLFGLLKRENPRSCIIFTNTKRAAEDLSRRLNKAGYTSEFIMGDLPQKKRSAIIKRVKHGELPVLVATDVAARGLHVNDLEMVINYDVPEDAENYVHRIGRTARAGKSGRACMLACERFVFGLPAIEDYINQKIPVQPVTEDMLETNIPSGQPSRSTIKPGPGRDSKPPRGAKPPRDSAPGKGPQRDSVSPKSGEARRDPAAQSKRESKRGKPEDTRKPASRPKKKDRSRPGSSRNGSPQPIAADASQEERLAYYRKKYGEDFVLKETVSGDLQTTKTTGKNTQDANSSKRIGSLVGKLFGGRKKK